jgi:DNA-binding transcriptional LysR family regulator
MSCIVAVAAAVAGHGIAVLPCLAADAHPALVRLTSVLQSWDMWAVTSEAARNSRRIKAVKEALVELIVAEAGRLAG